MIFAPHSILVDLILNWSVHCYGHSFLQLLYLHADEENVNSLVCSPSWHLESGFYDAGKLDATPAMCLVLEE